jgi:hypothetical protein
MLFDDCPETLQLLCSVADRYKLDPQFLAECIVYTWCLRAPEGLTLISRQPLTEQDAQDEEWKTDAPPRT